MQIGGIKVVIAMGRESCLWRVRQASCHPEQSEGSRSRCFPFDCAQGGGCTQHGRIQQLVARAPSLHSAGMKQRSSRESFALPIPPPDRGAASRRYTDATIRIIPGSPGAPAEPYATTGLLQSPPSGWDMEKPGFPTCGELAEPRPSLRGGARFPPPAGDGAALPETPHGHRGGVRRSRIDG